jgi:hypothetical protein
MENQQVSGESGKAEQPQVGPIVTVKVDGHDKEVHRGSSTVSEFKDKVGVDAALELAEVIDGQLKPLNDSDRIVIRGGEVFFSRVRKGSSS